MRISEFFKKRSNVPPNAGRVGSDPFSRHALLAIGSAAQKLVSCEEDYERASQLETKRYEIKTNQYKKLVALFEEYGLYPATEEKIPETPLDEILDDLQNLAASNSAVMRGATADNDAPFPYGSGDQSAEEDDCGGPGKATADTSNQNQSFEKTFEGQLRQLISRECLENHSDTPDFILAKYLTVCLEALNMAIYTRDVHKGDKPVPPASGMVYVSEFASWPADFDPKGVGMLPAQQYGVAPAKDSVVVEDDSD